MTLFGISSYLSNCGRHSAFPSVFLQRHLSRSLGFPRA
jgi:hypothetical protein